MLVFFRVPIFLVCRKNPFLLLGAQRMNYEKSLAYCNIVYTVHTNRLIINRKSIY